MGETIGLRVKKRHINDTSRVQEHNGYNHTADVSPVQSAK